MSHKTIKDKLLLSLQRWAIPSLLMLIAGRQILLTQTAGLSPWHGGGFGMFSSIDRDERRIITFQATDCQGHENIQLLTPEIAELDDAMWAYLTTLPDTSLLQSLGYHLLTLADVDMTPSPVTSVSSDCPIQLQMQVWRLHYDQASGEVWYAPVTSVVEVTL